MKFSDFQIDPSILRALREVGYETPTPIQAQAIPQILQGRDLIGCAQTGTGKTAAFSLPILQRMGKPVPGQDRPVRALILTPTRELALQIYENICQYGRYTGRVATVIYGGVSQVPQVEALTRGADILVATPGRLWDLMGQKLADISRVECFVLDEADRMLDMGFLPDVKRILGKLPRKRQTLLFSATMPPEIESLAKSILRRPVQVSVAPAATPVETIAQGIYFAEKMEKRVLLQEVLRERNLPQTLVFSRTKHGADRITRELNRAGIPARALHGDKSQGARQTALKLFKECKIAVLVATDIAARGLDISELPLVINFDLPNLPETYVHRIGRTGRAGMSGTALSFCAADEEPYLREIEALIRMSLPVLPWPERLAQAEEKKTAKAKPARKKAVVQSAEGGKPAKQASHRPAAPTVALAEKYPKPAKPAGRSAKNRRRSGEDEQRVDIASPRTNELSDEAAARVRAKIQQKLAERAAARQQQTKAESEPKKARRPEKGRKISKQSSDDLAPQVQKTRRRASRRRQGSRK